MKIVFEKINMEIIFLIGSPDFRDKYNPDGSKIPTPKWHLITRVREGESCFNTIIGYKNWRSSNPKFSEEEKYERRLRWISICFVFFGVKISW